MTFLEKVVLIYNLELVTLIILLEERFKKDNTQELVQNKRKLKEINSLG